MRKNGRCSTNPVAARNRRHSHLIDRRVDDERAIGAGWQTRREQPRRRPRIVGNHGAEMLEQMSAPPEHVTHQPLAVARDPGVFRRACPQPFEHRAPIRAEHARVERRDGVPVRGRQRT